MLPRLPTSVKASFEFPPCGVYNKHGNVCLSCTCKIRLTFLLMDISFSCYLNTYLPHIIHKKLTRDHVWDEILMSWCVEKGHHFCVSLKSCLSNIHSYSSTSENTGEYMGKHCFTTCHINITLA